MDRPSRRATSGTRTSPEPSSAPRDRPSSRSRSPSLPSSCPPSGPDATLVGNSAVTVRRQADAQDPGRPGGRRANVAHRRTNRPKSLLPPGRPEAPPSPGVGRWPDIEHETALRGPCAGLGEPTAPSSPGSADRFTAFGVSGRTPDPERAPIGCYAIDPRARSSADQSMWLRTTGSGVRIPSGRAIVLSRDVVTHASRHPRHRSMRLCGGMRPA